jgi:hypothetical protein
MSDKNEINKQVQWIRNPNQKGVFLFTFDGERIFNLFRDYPHELTSAQKEIFDAENPYWAEYFKERTQNNE